MVDDRRPAARLAVGVAGAADDVGRLVARPRPSSSASQLGPLGRLDHVVGVEPEGVVAGGAGQRRVAGGGEVVDPGEVEDPRPERAGDLHGAVGRAGVDDDDLVEEPGGRAQAGRQVRLLVADDHRQADPGRRAGLGAGLGGRPGLRATRRRRPRAGPTWRRTGAVLLEQRLGVDPRAGEGPAAEVVHEQVAGHGQLEAGPAGPHRQVVVVEEAQAEPLVEPADRLEDRPLDEQAEARELRRGRTTGRGARPATARRSACIASRSR